MKYTNSKKICVSDLRTLPVDEACVLITHAINDALAPLGLTLRWMNIIDFDKTSPDYNPDGNHGRFRIYLTDDAAAEKPDLTTKEAAIRYSKEIRAKGDAVVQMADHLRSELIKHAKDDDYTVNPSEAIASCVLSMRHFEDGVMRQGLVLKNIGNPNPYPESKDPASIKVEPTADNLKFAQ